MNGPALIGRFNFLSWKPDVFQLIFVPYDGAAAMLIAKNLTREQMEQLRTDLNGALDDFKEDYLGESK